MKPFEVLSVFAVASVLASPGFAQDKASAKEMPYVTVDYPQFIPASQAGFLNDSDRLIGVMDGNTAKAYPAADLAQHGVVQDRLAAGPIAVTW